MPRESLPTARHHWASMGVSGYPLSHPIVGQTRFYETFKHFIHLVDEENERFAHVFAIVAQWGVGKSRLAYELIAQINGTSRGWFVRDEAGTLDGASLFHDTADRDQYLGLYIRYSQIAFEYHNVDNWFGYGMYKALLPLARGEFDGSIQGQIAREAYDRLLVRGFEEAGLAEALELSTGHTDEKLYLDEHLVTRLCQAAYDYLKQFGIHYLVVALDELETAGEASTYGLEAEDLKRLDGRAIKLIGKAIKEEDPKRKLPFLRYVALCSPAIGDELRDIQSTARRFEMVELEPNSFSDVSDFVRTLQERGRLEVSYPSGLVEAAYAMSGGNFGWFNVVMANVDEVLETPHPRGGRPETVGEIFEFTLRGSSRMREYVLDRQAIGELQLDRKFQADARQLLYGQLPVPLDGWPDESRRALLAARNEYDEPVATLYRRVEWPEQDVTQALRAAKFVRDKGVWKLGGVDQALDVKQLLANLGTYALHAGGGTSTGDRHVLLVPLRLPEFVELVSMLYPHPAAEDAARAIWRGTIGEEDLETSGATHFGPSIAMLGRLDLRYRRQSQNALIFREPDKSSAHERAMASRKGQHEDDRANEILVGAMRALDDNWGYDQIGAGIKGIPAIVTSPGQGRRAAGGLMRLEALMLHPEKRLVIAWVRNREQLESLCRQASSQFGELGRTPILALTSSVALVDLMRNPPPGEIQNASSYLLLHQFSASEEFILQQIGLPTAAYEGFRLSPQIFTTAFANRIQTLIRSLKQSIQVWRRGLDSAGRIAWPMRSAGPLKESELETLFDAWIWLEVRGDEPRPLARLDEASGLRVGDVQAALGKLGITPRARVAGYEESERAALFDPLDDAAEPQFPPFLCDILERLLDKKIPEWSYDLARREWFWGYTWEPGITPRETYQQWMGLACRLGFARESSGGRSKSDKTYRLVELEEWRGRRQEARNWLDGDYGVIVGRMEQVFGPGKVLEYFAPPGYPRVGTKTRSAERDLETADDLIQNLMVRERNRPPGRTMLERGRSLAECSQGRLEAEELIFGVFEAEEFVQLASDAGLTQLNFEDDTRPLWERIGRADHFAEFVLRARDRIESRAESLQEEMRVAAADLPGFPIGLFTRCLSKVRDILEGAFSVSGSSGSTQRRQHTEADTLGHYLQDLNVAQARERLGRLTREVGVSLETGTEQPIGEIDGQIVRAYLELKQGYEQELRRLEDLESRLTRIASLLDGSPDDFAYPAAVPQLVDLLGQPEIIRGELQESLAEDVEQLFAEHDRAAKLGNFQPLMTAAKGLLHGPKTALGRLAGHVLTLDNAANAYLRRLVTSAETRDICEALNAMLTARGGRPEPALEYDELEQSGSLAAAASLAEQRKNRWARRGATMLETTGVTFDEWRAVVSAIRERGEPGLGPEQAESLVGAGFLRRTYSLGGSL